MAQSVSEEVERLKKRIENGERDIDQEQDKQRLIEFSGRIELLREQYSDHRHLKLLRHLTRIAEKVGGLDDSLKQREAAEDIVRWIHSEYDNQETNRDYRVALRVFGKRVTSDNDEDPPDSINWISAETSRDYNPTPDPADMLELEEDIEPMIEAARNPRDKALIGVQYEAGLRGGELFDLTVGDVSDGDHGLYVRVDGKNGQRSVPLVAGFSIPHLQRWLSEHPASNDMGAPLWSKLNRPERYSYQRFLQCFKEAAKRANVAKPVTPTDFRKSNAYWLAKRRDANAALIEDRQGRVRGSDAVSRYIARFGEDTEAQYARLQGKDIDVSEPKDRDAVECPRCTRENPTGEETCVWCGQVLGDYETVREIKAKQEEVREAAFRLVKSNPELLDDIEAARELQTVIENNPELFEDVQRFKKALADS